MSELAIVGVVDRARRHLLDCGDVWINETLAGLVESVGGAQGAIAFDYRTGAPEPSLQARYGDEGLFTVFGASMGALDPPSLRHVFGSAARCLSAAEVFRARPPRNVQDAWQRAGVTDSLSLFANHPSAVGTSFNVALERPFAPTHRTRAAWLIATRQLGLLGRLRRELATHELDDISAVRCAPDGRVRSISPGLAGTRLRERLRSWAGRWDRAQCRQAPSSERTALWRELADGDWLLVDQFESDGRRNIVFVPCPGGSGAGALTEQQRTVAEAVGRGLSNRRVAREVGMSPRSVSTQLRRAMIKLGVRSRVELVRLWSALEGAPGTAAYDEGDVLYR